jgi:hypothetical protein
MPQPNEDGKLSEGKSLVNRKKICRLEMACLK